MKVVLRADDVGYTHVHNLGTFKTMTEGFCTHCDIMFDGFGAQEACLFLKDRPWISIGWHPHFWCKPVLEEDKVKSLVDDTGRLKWHRIDCKEHPVYDVDEKELENECRAQLKMCKELIGRYPDTCTIIEDNGNKAKILRKLCDEYKIHYDFMGGIGPNGKEHVVLNRYKTLNIKEYFTSGIHPANPKLRVHLFDNYDPVLAIIDMPIEEETIFIRSLHPGYLDDLILKEQHCTIHRVKDVEAYCDQRLLNWIIDNKIELINNHDALYGTNQFQNHLKEISSPLWVGNMK